MGLPLNRNTRYQLIKWGEINNIFKRWTHLFAAHNRNGFVESHLVVAFELFDETKEHIGGRSGNAAL